MRDDTNPWLCSYTRWISWVHQHICGNSFVSDSTGSHKENRLEDYMERKAMKRTIFFPCDGRWAHDIGQSAGPQFRSCPKVSLGATPVEKYMPAAESTCLLQFLCNLGMLCDICDLSAGPDKNTFKGQIFTSDKWRISEVHVYKLY